MKASDRVIENCFKRRDAALQEAMRLTQVLRDLGASDVEIPWRSPYGSGFGADIPVTADEDTAWASL